MSTNPFDLANAGIRNLSPYVPGKAVDALEREYGITNIVKLASNENPLGPSKLAKAAVAAASADLTRYPDGAGFRLKSKLGQVLKVSADQIALGNGSNEILELLARTFLAPGYDAIMSEHAFAVYPLVTLTAGANVVSVPARQWAHDLDAMADAITEKTRIIFIANPNNPTGTWVSRGELRAFLKAVPDTVIVVLDEAYFEYVDQENYPDGVKLLGEFPNLVVTRTFSKIYGLAALRIGYSVSSEAITDLLNRARQPFNVNSLAQEAAMAAMDDTEYVSRSRNLNNLGVTQLEEGFDALNLNYIGSVGNFICVNVGSNAMAIYESLLKKGVIVRPVANYNMPDYLRVTVGTEAENNVFLAALADILATS